MIGQIPLLTTASLLLLSNSATALPPQSANTKTLLTRDTGFIDVNQACIMQYGSGFTAQTIGDGPNDWVCVRGNERKGVDLKRYCCEIRNMATCCEAYTFGGVYTWWCAWGC